MKFFVEKSMLFEWEPYTLANGPGLHECLSHVYVYNLGPNCIGLMQFHSPEHISTAVTDGDLSLLGPHGIYLTKTHKMSFSNFCIFLKTCHVLMPYHPNQTTSFMRTEMDFESNLPSQATPTSRHRARSLNKMALQVTLQPGFLPRVVVYGMHAHSQGREQPCSLTPWRWSSIPTGCSVAISQMKIRKVG